MRCLITLVGAVFAYVVIPLLTEDDLSFCLGFGAGLFLGAVGVVQAADWLWRSF